MAWANLDEDIADLFDDDRAGREIQAFAKARGRRALKQRLGFNTRKRPRRPRAPSRKRYLLPPPPPRPEFTTWLSSLPPLPKTPAQLAWEARQRAPDPTKVSKDPNFSTWLSSLPPLPPWTPRGKAKPSPLPQERP